MEASEDELCSWETGGTEASEEDMMVREVLALGKGIGIMNKVNRIDKESLSRRT